MRNPISSNRLPRPHRPNYYLAIAVIGLCFFGLTMVFSASVTKSYAESGGQSTTTYLYHQLTSLIIGVCFWIAAYKIDYPVWRRLAPKLFYLSIFILIMVLFMGRTAGGAQRWLDLGVRTFQPTELIKITFILFMAFWFEQRLSQINSSNVAIPFVSIIAFL